ncbi:transposable element Tcb2 transposase [Trichonephila clavipes]|nr:transposable element Tcb2 transposase [Trichonephila clavipes]
MCSRRHGGGRVRSTTPAKDKYIVLSAKRNRRTTAQQVANQFLAASGKQISRKIVARQHCTARLQWCREHHNWTEQDWACVLFSDESRFSLSSDCRRQLIWRESGTAYRQENIQEKDRYPTCSIMVWAGIMINGRTRLHVVANGTMMGQRYIDEVLLTHVRLFRGAVGDKFVFMGDNATCHQTLAVQDCLDSEGIQRLVWPARSPDLNPIKMCGMLWGGKLLVETILRQTRTPTSVHSQRNGINCLNSCWIMLCKVWYDVWNVASHSTGGSKDYEKEFVRAQLSVILEERVEREKEEKIARQHANTQVSQVSVVRINVVEGQSVDNGGAIQITSTFGEHEMGELKVFDMEINNARHGVVPISKKLVNGILICSSDYEGIIENSQLVRNPVIFRVSSKKEEIINSINSKSVCSQEVVTDLRPETYTQTLSNVPNENLVAVEINTSNVHANGQSSKESGKNVALSVDVSDCML